MSLHSVQLHKVDLNLLVVFDALMREQHVGRTAQALSVTPSAVSHALGRLRELLNDPLFVRHAKGMNPTKLALSLELRVRGLLDEIKGVFSISEGFDPKVSERTFTIGVSDYTSSLFATTLVEWIGSNAPAIKLNLQPITRGSTPKALEFGGVDLVITPEKEFPDRFRITKVLEDSFVTVSRRQGPQASRSWTMEAFLENPHILVSPGGGTRGIVDDALSDLGFSRRILFTLPTFLAALDIAGRSDCILSLPQSIASRYGPKFDLVTRPLPFEPPRLSIFAVTAPAAEFDAGTVWMRELIENLLALE